MHPALDNIRLIAYDLDGTLIDSAPDLALALDHTLTERGFAPAGVANTLEWIGNGTHKLVERALSHAGAFKNGPDEALLNAAFEAFMRCYADNLVVHTHLYPGVRDCLTAMRERGLPQVLITNKTSRFIDPLLTHLGIGEFFELRLGGDTLATQKPDPAPLLHAAQHYGVAPVQALMVGDSGSDIDAAKNAGFRSLAVSYGYNHGQGAAALGPDHVVDSLGELV
ncbi:phosphoglycolate phosphatase [Kushneria aurantia]|uniref:Phosphoglycolate phosphatase n=1 Tax=Kushneria aurantia TaxID=504092 RepID=A0ABV6G3U9_9GAMM|nr:phosphoglycolate phosphatase [Kushneria aurantia]